MPNTDVPDKRTLVEATGIAAIVAAVMLLLFILPAEHGIDPTGVGGVLGLTALSDPPSSAHVHTPEDAPYRQDVVEIYVPALEGIEYKFAINAGSGFVYTWNASTSMYFDFHGEPENGRPGYFQSYEEDTKQSASGIFQAPFDGSHGWYFRNDTTTPVVVTLETAGHYEITGVV